MLQAEVLTVFLLWTVFFRTSVEQTALREKASDCL